MSTIRFALAAALAVGIVSAKSEAHAAEPMIGYVNLQRAIMEVDEGKRAKSALRKTYEKKQQELSKREQELKAMKDALDKEAAGKNDADTRRRQVEFQSKYLELQQVFMKESQELQALQEKEVAAIQEKMRKIITEIGKGGGYTLILEIQENRLLFAKPHLDVTNEVIRKYNARHK